MTTETVDDMTIGLTKLRLRPGDTLFISLPDAWSEFQIKEFEQNFRVNAQLELAGVQIFMLSESMKIYVRRSEPPPDPSRLLRLIPAAGAA